MKTLNVKKGDTVIVITGKKGKEGIKGKQGRVISANPDANQVTVDGLRMQKRHTKAKNAKSQSGIIEKAGPIDVSNVMVVCPKCGKPTRVGHGIDENGKKIRVCKRKVDGVVCGASLDKGIKLEKKSKKAEEAAAPAEKKAAKTEETAKAPVKKTVKKTVKAAEPVKAEEAVKAAEPVKAEAPEKEEKAPAAKKAPAAEKVPAAEKAEVKAPAKKRTAKKAEDTAADKADA